ncbi:MAG: MBL fold metallo-hydrolase [Alphaproteobacteria bacterium]|nr:MBL fold metallo-hydrolase [Alphaproteobacteria bacterium]
MKITILGCGSSMGVPALKYGWGICDPKNPKNRRTRSSIIIEDAGTVLLVDASPDLREQLLRFDGRNEKLRKNSVQNSYGNLGKNSNENLSPNIDAILFTHAHFDHTNGINELRPLYIKENKFLDVFATADTLSELYQNFSYLFQRNSHDIYDSYLYAHEIFFGKFSIKNISGICFEQDHGFSKSLGFRIGNFAYCTDVTGFSDFSVLENLDIWIVDCLNSDEKRPTHANLELVLSWVEKLNPKKTYLTHMDTSMDYDSLMNSLPPNVEPAYDMQILYCK